MPSFVQRITLLSLLAGVCAFAPAAPAQATLLVAARNSDQVFRYDETTGSYVESFASGSAPQDVAYGNGKVYVSYYTFARVESYDKQGNHLGTFADGLAPPAAQEWYGPTGLAVGSNGDVFVASNISHEILRYNSSGSLVSRFGSSNLVQPTGITLDAAGNLYVADQLSTGATGTILRFPKSGDSYGTPTTYVAPGLGGLSFPQIGLEFHEGDLYVTSGTGTNATTGARILRYFDDGTSFEIIADHTDGLSTPSGLAFGPRDTLYISDRGVSKIFEFDLPTKTVTDEFDNGTSGLNSPRGLLLLDAMIVPEPSSCVLSGAMLLGLGAVGCRRRRR